MAHRHSAVPQLLDLARDRRAPFGVVRIGLIGHARVADVITVPERALQAGDQLVVPRVVDVLPAALDEDDLSHHWTTR